MRTRTAILTAMSPDLKTPITRLRLRGTADQPEVRGHPRSLGMEGMVSTLGYMRGPRRPRRFVLSMSLRCWRHCS